MKSCLFLLAALAVPASAFEWKSRFTDGPSVGWLTGGDLEDDAFAYGWQAGYDVTPLLGLELGYTYWEDEIGPDFLAAYGLPDGAKVNLDNHAIALSARLHLLRRETWSLFAGGGASWFISSEEDQPVNDALARRGNGTLVGSDIEVNHEVALHLLAGAEYSFSRHWELFGEARWVFADYDLDARLINRDAQGALFSTHVQDSFPYDHTLLRLGLNYRF